MRLSILVDRESERADVRVEWGASVYIRWAGRSVLFDMGTTGVFADNAEILGLPVDEVEFAVLSHGHTDHGGGLERFLAENTSAPVWACAGVTAESFPRLGILKKPVGIDTALVVRHLDRFRFIDGDTQVTPGVHLLTRIPHRVAAPKGNKLLWRREGEGLARDDFSHELMLVIDDGDGLVLFTGCSHNGVLNMVETARNAFPDRPIKALVGGFHFVGIPVGPGLLGDGDAAVREIAKQLRAAGIPRILTTHCTGRRAYELLREVIGPAVEYVGAGAEVEV